MLGNDKKSSTVKELITALDGTKIDRPAKNSIFFCQQLAVIGNVSVSILPASFYTLIKPNSSWIKNGKILIDKVPTVPGSITMKHEFKNTKTNLYRHLYGNGIPGHDEKIQLFESLVAKQDLKILEERILMGNHAPVV